MKYGISFYDSRSLGSSIGLLGTFNIAMMRMRQDESDGYKSKLCKIKSDDDLTGVLIYTVYEYSKLRTGERRGFDIRNKSENGWTLGDRTESAY